MRKSIFVVALIVATFTANAAPTPTRTEIVQNYISRFLNIATLESVRSGIPTSIILGQGILESVCGTSKLALSANNHFGIKWNSPEDGAYVLRHDDDRNSCGERIQSRFIKYNSIEESFTHHTDFLMYRKNYSRLFNFDRTDYENWAKGLSQCHYATDPEYATKLIATIEKYRLYDFDIASFLTLEGEDDVESQVVQNNEAPQNSFEDAAQAEAQPTTQNSDISSHELGFEITSSAKAPKAKKPNVKPTVQPKKQEENELIEITNDDNYNGTRKKQQPVTTTHRSQR